MNTYPLRKSWIGQPLAQIHAMQDRHGQTRTIKRNSKITLRARNKQACHIFER